MGFVLTDCQQVELLSYIVSIGPFPLTPKWDIRYLRETYRYNLTVELMQSNFHIPFFKV